MLKTALTEFNFQHKHNESSEGAIAIAEGCIHLTRRKLCMTTKSTDKEAGASTAKVSPSPHAEVLKQAAFELYTSNHIGTDDVANRLGKLEAYLNKVDGKEVEE